MSKSALRSRRRLIAREVSGSCYKSVDASVSASAYCSRSRSFVLEVGICDGASIILLVGNCLTSSAFGTLCESPGLRARSQSLWRQILPFGLVERGSYVARHMGSSFAYRHVGSSCAYQLFERPIGWISGEFRTSFLVRGMVWPHCKN